MDALNQVYGYYIGGMIVMEEKIFVVDDEKGIVNAISYAFRYEKGNCISMIGGKFQITPDKRGAKLIDDELEKDIFT